MDLALRGQVVPLPFSCSFISLSVNLVNLGIILKLFVTFKKDMVTEIIINHKHIARKVLVIHLRYLPNLLPYLSDLVLLTD